MRTIFNNNLEIPVLKILALHLSDRIAFQFSPNNAYPKIITKNDRMLYKTPLLIDVPFTRN